MPCPMVDKCPLFPQFTLEANLKFWMQHYCEADFERCERYKTVQRGGRPHETMLPDGKELVVTIRKKNGGAA